jgi:hypothetical protein
MKVIPQLPYGRLLLKVIPQLPYGRLLLKFKIFNKLALMVVVLLLTAGVSASFASDGEVLSIQAYFECLMGRKFSNVAHLQRMSELSEKEIYRLGWLVSSVRPMSSWRFQTGEITSIRKFRDRYEITFRLPAVKKEYLKSGFTECLYYDEARTAKREWVEETRILPVKDGKFEKDLLKRLEDAVVGDLEKSLSEYRKHGKKVDLMELLVEEALIDTMTLDKREKEIIENFTKGNK